MIRGESWTKPENIKAALSLAGQAGGGPVLYCENNRCCDRCRKVLLRHPESGAQPDRGAGVLFGC